MIRKFLMPLALAASAACAFLPSAASARTIVEFSVGGGYPYGYYEPGYYYGPRYYSVPADYYYYYDRPRYYYREGWRDHRRWDRDHWDRDHWRHGDRGRWEHHGRGW